MSWIRFFQSWGRCSPQNSQLLGRQKGVDRRTVTDVLRVTRRQYFAAFQTFFCDLERVAQWLHAFQLVGISPDEFCDEEWLDLIEHRGFVCQGPELAAITIEYRENKIAQIAFRIRFDTSKLVSLTDSDAKIDEMIHTVQHKSLALRGEVESELRGD